MQQLQADIAAAAAFTCPIDHVHMSAADGGGYDWS